MKILNHNGNEVPILHFQGRSRDVYYNAINKLREQEIGIPENLEIITFCNQAKISEAPLIYQLDKNKIAYKNSAKDIITWENKLKIDLVLQAINSVNSEYVLILDSLDVVLTQAITEMIDRYKKYGKDVLFGATKNNHPNQLIDKVAMRDWFGQFKYLNAGTCIGEKAKVKKFYSLCADVSNKIINPTDSEQLIVRTVFDKCQDWVGFDYNCECFQTFNRVEIDVSNDGSSWTIK